MENALETLRSLIKKGKWGRNEVGVDLLGVPIFEDGYKEVSYKEAEDFAKKSKISSESLKKCILSSGSVSFLWKALEETKDFDTYALAWLKKDKGTDEGKFEALKSLGASEDLLQKLKYDLLALSPIASENQKTADVLSIDFFNNEEDFVKMYLFGDSKRLYRLSKIRGVKIVEGESLIKNTFATYGIDINKYSHLFDQITNERIFLDLLKGANAKDLSLVKMYFNKFDNLDKIEPYFIKQMNGIVKEYLANNYSFYITNGKVNKTNFEHAFTKDVCEVLDSLAKSKVPIMKKLRFIFDGSLSGFASLECLNLKKTDFNPLSGFFGTNFIELLTHKKEFYEFIQELAKPLAKQYLDYVGSQSYITNVNKDNFAIGHNVYPSKNGGFNSQFMYHLANNIYDYMKDDGLVQEYCKYLFVNGGAVKRYSQIFISRQDEAEEIEKAYKKSLSYKETPIPFEFLYQKELRRATTKPAFILVRSALKLKDFNKKLLSDLRFYEEGFKGRAFAESNKKWAEKNGYSTREIPQGEDYKNYLPFEVNTDKVYDDKFKKFLKNGNVYFFVGDRNFKWVSNDGYSKLNMLLRTNGKEYRFFVNNSSRFSANRDVDKGLFYREYWDIDYDREVLESDADKDAWKIVSFINDTPYNSWAISLDRLDASERYDRHEYAFEHSIDDTNLDVENLSEENKQKEEEANKEGEDLIKRLQGKDEFEETKRYIDFYKSLGYDNRQVEVMTGELNEKEREYLLNDEPAEEIIESYDEPEPEDNSAYDTILDEYGEVEVVDSEYEDFDPYGNDLEPTYPDNGWCKERDPGDPDDILDDIFNGLTF